ncbi:MAG TPA: phosphate/phosphite/phosphonate ABC transporter substrate-binding protein [Candidatus Thermoplasmatota archaeon]|nr:phosphate/phosphite/phosphonate ABC transporter substrate-binding protein [Candidatus Thermoplasmatota archaeon]
MRQKMILCSIAVGTLVLAGCLGPLPSATNGSNGGATTIRLAIQPTQDAAAIQSQAADLERFLEEQTGYDFQIFVPLTYIGVIEALKYGHADVAMMSAWPAATAAAVANARIELAEWREVIVQGQPVIAPSYYSYYVVLADSPYQTLDELRGKTVAYPSTTSTSGYVYPVAKLVERQLVPAPAAGREADPKAFFGNVLASGGYQGAWNALRNGQADVAVTAGDIAASLFYEVLNNTRVVETQGPIPSHAVVFGEEFTGEKAARTKAAFLELKGEKKETMRKLVSAIFVEFRATTTAEHVAPLQSALTTTGLRLVERL